MLEIVIHALKHTVLESLKLLPFIFLVFLFLEYIEHKMNEKSHELIHKAGNFGPLIGSVLGAVPQCGFSAMASNLYATRVITLGTLVSIFLSTSDEMFVIMLARADKSSITKGLILISIKIIIALVVGFVIDFILKKKNVKESERIHDFCEQEHCKCEHGVLRSAIHHTLRVIFFIFIVSLLLNFAIEYFGEEILAKLLLKNSIFAPVLAGVVGLIPNCASSVIITEMYLSKAISFGSCLSGLLVGSGVGMLILFKVNRPMKKNIFIAFLVFLIGVSFGVIADLIGISL
ncbi:MAG: arsenic efflux protein [Clostridia bacterium]|nr:arsenic efflux protein [Clostridia bacterium]